MESRTASVTLEAPKDQVFAWLSRIETVPAWATEFVREFEVVSDGRARATTAMGEVMFRIESDAETGVIDFLVGAEEGETGRFPARVVPLGPGRAAFLFTMFRAPGQAVRAFEAEHASLVRELENIRRRFASDRIGA